MLRGRNTYLAPLALADGEILYEWINARLQLMLSATYKPTYQSSHHEWMVAVTTRASVLPANHTLEPEPLYLNAWNDLKTRCALHAGD
jgi:hypothetical protein